MKHEEPILSVVVPTRNRRKSTHFVLSELSFHAIPRCQIVITDNSDDGQLATEFNYYSRFFGESNSSELTIFKNLPNIGGSRNQFIGINSAKGEWILMTTSRTLIHNQTVLELANWLESSEATDQHIGFLELNGHPVFERKDIKKPIAVNIDHGINAAVYAFNRGSTLSGIVFRKSSMLHKLFKLDRGIYPHVPPFTEMAYRYGCFQFFSSIAVYNGELSYAHEHEIDSRPACHGLSELIQYAHEFSIANELYNDYKNDKCFELLRQKRFLLEALLVNGLQAAEMKRLNFSRQS